jgi:hypothetical protein
MQAVMVTFLSAALLAILCFTPPGGVIARGMVTEWSSRRQYAPAPH